MRSSSSVVEDDSDIITPQVAINLASVLRELPDDPTLETPPVTETLRLPAMPAMPAVRATPVMPVMPLHRPSTLSPFETVPWPTDPGAMREPAPTIEWPPPQRSTLRIGWLVACTVVALVGVGAGVFGSRAGRGGQAITPLAPSAIAALCASYAASTPALPALPAPPSPPAPPAAPAPPATAASAAATTPAATTATTPVVPAREKTESLGRLLTADARPHHRIFVDGKVVGETPATVTLACGPHAVRLGSAGALQRVDVPCGEALRLRDR